MSSSLRRRFLIPQGGGLLLLLLLLFLTFGCSHSERPPLLVATAANMQPVMDSLCAQFTAQTGLAAEQVVGSSGKLSAQIQTGAPFEVFISADTAYPAFLYQKGLGAEPPQVYAYGTLVLLGATRAPAPRWTALSESLKGTVALANPHTAPYGIAGEEVLGALGIGDQLAGRRVWGESISQVNQFVLSGAAAWGFTSQSIVYAHVLGDALVSYPVPDSLYTPIAQAALLLQRETGPSAEAKAFFAFLFSPEARHILSAYGYRLPDEK